MKEKQKLMFNRKYDKEETPSEKYNRMRTRNRKLEKENKRLKSELRMLDQSLSKSLDRIRELTSDTELEVLIGTQKEAEETEDFPDTQVTERKPLLGQTAGGNRKN